MTGNDSPQRALRDALAARDQSNPAPSFASLQAQSRAGIRQLHWRPMLAGVASAAVVAAGLALWTGTRGPHGIDTRLASELSSSSYWSVPTDQLLAYGPAPMSFELTAPELQVSLEESVL